MPPLNLMTAHGTVVGVLGDGQLIQVKRSASSEALQIESGDDAASSLRANPYLSQFELVPEGSGWAFRHLGRYLSAQPDGALVCDRTNVDSWEIFLLIGGDEKSPRSLSRAAVLQPLIDLFDNPHYLEIGVSAGDTFHEVKANSKIGIDPNYLFDVAEKRVADGSRTYFDGTSDSFFISISQKAPPFDVIFLDGLHTFEQSLRDLTNCIEHSHANTIIVVDDVLPSDYASAVKNQEVQNRLRAADHHPPGDWMGDVYRLVYFIAAFLPAWSYATVNDNHGQLIMWRGRRPATELTVEEISRVPFEATVLDRGIFNMTPYELVLDQLRRKISGR